MSWQQVIADRGTAAGLARKAGTSWTPPRYSQTDRSAIRRRMAAYWWAAFVKASEPPAHTIPEGTLE